MSDAEQRARRLRELYGPWGPPAPVAPLTPKMVGAVVGASTEFHMRAHDAYVPAVAPLPGRYHRLEVPYDKGAQHNPTVFVQAGELWAIVRSLPANESYSTNHWGRVGPDWKLEAPRPLHARRPLSPPLEDLRAFVWRGSVWAMAATHTGGQAIRQCFVRIRPDGVVAEAYVQHSSRHEKNWMPCLDGEHLRFVYSVTPLVVLEMTEKFSVEPEASTFQLPERGVVRGGSQLVRHGAGWIAIVHQVFRPPAHAGSHNPLLGGWAPSGPPDPIAGDAKVVYVHHFVRFNERLTKADLSRPFFFREIGIEFCPGLTPWREGFVAAFGVKDREAWLVEFEPSVVDALF